MRAAQPLPTNNTSSKGRIRRDARTLGLSGVSRTLISRISIRDSNHADELRMVPQTALCGRCAAHMRWAASAHLRLNPTQKRRHAVTNQNNIPSDEYANQSWGHKRRFIYRKVLQHQLQSRWRIQLDQMLHMKIRNEEPRIKWQRLGKDTQQVDNNYIDDQDRRAGPRGLRTGDSLEA